MDELFFLEKEIFKFLVQNENLTKIVKNIYTYVPDNIAYPFVKIGKLSKRNLYFTMANMIHAEIQIEVFFDNFSNKQCLKVLNLIEKTLQNKKISLDGYMSGDFKIYDVCMFFSKDIRVWHGIINSKVKFFSIH